MDVHDQQLDWLSEELLSVGLADSEEPVSDMRCRDYCSVAFPAPRLRAAASPHWTQPFRKGLWLRLCHAPLSSPPIGRCGWRWRRRDSKDYQLYETVRCLNC